MKYLFHRFKFAIMALDRKRRSVVPATAFFPDKKVGYILIPKVACSSLRICLSESSVDTPQEEIPKYFRKNSVKVVDNIEEYFVFAFVRNPFSRVVSLYKDKIEGATKETTDSHLKYYLGGFLIDSSSFEDYLNRIAVIPESLHESHFAKQYNILYKRNGVLPNYIGKFEKLSKDWAFLQEQFDLGNLPHLNATSKTDWRDYYNEETVHQVYQLYKKDIESFGYVNEYKKLLDYVRSKP